MLNIGEIHIELILNQLEKARVKFIYGDFSRSLKVYNALLYAHTKLTLYKKNHNAKD